MSLEYNYQHKETIIPAPVAYKVITSDFNKAMIEKCPHLIDQCDKFLYKQDKLHSEAVVLCQFD